MKKTLLLSTIALFFAASSFASPQTHKHHKHHKHHKQEMKHDKDDQKHGDKDKK